MGGFNPQQQAHYDYNIHRPRPFTDYRNSTEPEPSEKFSFRTFFMRAFNHRVFFILIFTFLAYGGTLSYFVMIGNRQATYQEYIQRVKIELAQREKLAATRRAELDKVLDLRKD